MMGRRAFDPRPYQDIIMDHVLATPRCAVWAGMGMGKTISALTAVDALELVEPGPTLVTAPLRVAQSTWPDEAVKWRHLRNVEVTPIVGTAAARRKALARAFSFSASVFTVNYENIPWLVETLADQRKPWPFGKIIPDEATRLKSFRTRQGGKRARALGQVAHLPQVRHFIELTGTPSPNGLKDLWGQAWFLDRGQRLGRSFEAFKSRWFQTIQVGADPHAVDLVPLPYAQREIEDLLRDLCISLNPADWFDLHEPISVPVYIDLPDQARDLYRDMEREMFMQLDGHDVEAFNAAARTIKCLQLANGAAYTTEDEGENRPWAEVHSLKLQALESIIEEAAGAPLLVAYHFKPDLARLLKAFPKGHHLDTDPQTLRDFKAGRIPLLFAHPDSAGHGLDGMQDVCNAVVFFGHWWNLESRQQIIERVGAVRQAQAGHDRPTYIYDIIARSTVDELVIARHKTKRGVQDLLLEAMKKGTCNG